METRQIWNAHILYDKYRYEANNELQEYLDNPNTKQLIASLKQKTYIVLGGDGSMLRAIEAYHESDIPFLWINFGTKGFLMNQRDCLDESPELIPFSYPLIDITVKIWDETFHQQAFNEAQIKTSGGHLINLDVVIDSHSHIQLRGDGVLIVTPAGSTWYNTSAWGPILPHSSQNFILTPLLTFDPKNLRPVIFENHQTVTITNEHDRKNGLSIYADSTPIIEKTLEAVEITIQKSTKKVTLLISKKQQHLWQARIYQEQWFNHIS